MSRTSEHRGGGIGRTRANATTAAALVAFAGNSLLCRAALGGGAIDPAGFTAIRLASGAVVLVALVAARGGARAIRERLALGSGLLLLVYAAPFSWAYVRLPAGAGALLLFAAVQGTMLLGARRASEEIGPRRWLGLALALAGLAILLTPASGGRDANALDPAEALLMLVAGAAWGLYSLRGRRSSPPAEDAAAGTLATPPARDTTALPTPPADATDPVAATAANFVVALGLSPLLLGRGALASDASPSGVLLAIASGALASGLGYALWYAALPRLRAADAALLQLAVPVLAALGGVLLLDEPLTARFSAAALLVLSGVALGIAAPDRAVQGDAAPGVGALLQNGGAPSRRLRASRSRRAASTSQT